MENKYYNSLNFLLAITLVAASFIFQGNISFNLWDEGYLWYGVQRTMLGEIPIRDFMSYDPGRYYWSAALMHAWGDSSIMALRASVAVFQSLGLFCGLLIISRNVKKQNFLYLFLSAITLIIWMLPRHKLFDISLSIFLIGILSWLIESPTSRRYFITGLSIGIVAVFGRNHGIYGMAGSLGIIFWLNINRLHNVSLMKGLFHWTIGILIGFSPILLMTLFIPGFAIAFWHSITFLFELKATNYPLPIPWPWLPAFNSLSIIEYIRQLFVGLFFIVILLAGISSMLWVILQKKRSKPVSAAFVAASFLMLPYAHYAYSRADVAHLAQGIYPFLISSLLIIATQKEIIRWFLGGLLFCSSFWVISIYQPVSQCIPKNICDEILISGNQLLIDKKTAKDIKLLKDLTLKYATNDKSILVTPFWPGAYPLLNRKSPMWESYALFKRSDSFQSAEIKRIKDAQVGFILLMDIALDGRDDFRFVNTHPLINKYIVDNYQRIQFSQSPEYQIYIVK